MRDFTVSVPNQRAVLFDRYRYEWIIIIRGRGGGEEGGSQ